MKYIQFIMAMILLVSFPSSARSEMEEIFFCMLLKTTMRKQQQELTVIEPEQDQDVDEDPDRASLSHIIVQECAWYL